MLNLEREVGVAPLIGYRSFGFVRPHYILCGGIQVLEPRKKTEAACNYHDDHLAPEDNCSCGLYAHKTMEQNIASGYVSTAVMSGEVYLWGKVIEGTKGFRAQYMYPKRLTIWTSNFQPLAPLLQELYGIPFEVGHRPISYLGAAVGTPTRRTKPLTLEELVAFALREDLDAQTRRYAITQAKFRLTGKLERAKASRDNAIRVRSNKEIEMHELQTTIDMLLDVRGRLNRGVALDPRLKRTAEEIGDDVPF